MKTFRNLRQRLSAALTEDGAFNDITTGTLIGSRSKKVSGFLLCKQNGIFAGGFLIREIFRLLDRRVTISFVENEGAKVKKGSKIARFQLDARALLAGERTLLNLVCHLSGVATLTGTYVDAVRGTGAQILDTRKTTPLWRDLEKHAVFVAGGTNHRFSLSDAVLVKDNHWALAAQAGRRIADVFGPGKTHRGRFRPTFVCIEATSEAQVWEAIKARADIILLDNLPDNQLKEAIVFIRAARRALKSDRPLIEASGGVNLERARRLAELGVDRISIGAITHSAPALDISLEVVNGRL